MIKTPYGYILPENKKTIKNIDMSNMKCLVIDIGGIFTEVAVRFARDCGAVRYFAHWQNAFPEMVKAKVGFGLEGVERVDHCEDHYDWADFIFVPDTYCCGLVEYLKKHNYPVAGAGKAEWLENNRQDARETQKKMGLPAQETHIIKGVTKLREFSKNHKDYYVKIDSFRGVAESFPLIDGTDAEGEIDYIAFQAGPFKEEIVFIVEKCIKGPETGYDEITFDGETLYPLTIGYEMRGCGYVAKVCDEKEFPKPLKRVRDALAAEFKKSGTKFYDSTEVIMSEEDKEPYLIDPSIRKAAPGVFSIQLELITNYSSVAYGLATGQKVYPIMSHKYAVAASHEAERAKDRWLKVSFPEKYRRWFKLRMAVKIGGDYYAAKGFDSICTAVGLGNTIQEAWEKAKEVSSEIKAIGIESNIDKIDNILKKIEEGKKYGIDF